MFVVGGWLLEIDIMELVGKEVNVIYVMMYDMVNGKIVVNGMLIYIDIFIVMYIYGLNWIKDVMIWYIDGMEVF